MKTNERLKEKDRAVFEEKMLDACLPKNRWNDHWETWQEAVEYARANPPMVEGEFPDHESAAEFSRVRDEKTGSHAGAPEWLNILCWDISARWMYDRMRQSIAGGSGNKTEPDLIEHPDDQAVDRFAAAMKEKLALARAKGRKGWETCSPEDLSRMLRDHVEKGDPRDVANFCMMLWNLHSGISKPAPDEPTREQVAELTKAIKNALLFTGSADSDRGHYRDSLRKIQSILDSAIARVAEKGGSK